MNREETNAYHREWRKANPDKQRAYYQRRKEEQRIYAATYHPAHKKERKNCELKKAYGISLEQFNRMYEKQHGLCAICNKEIEGKSCHTDHCHETGQVRGLLCSKCNRGIGNFNDNSSLLKRAADYIQGSEVTRLGDFWKDRCLSLA